MMLWQVTISHERSYKNPVSGKAGDVFKTGKQNNWQGHIWVWCINQTNHEGWVAKSILKIEGSQAILQEDFDAIELSVSQGEQVKGSKQLAGWLWSTNSQGKSGWVPLKNLKEASI